MIFPRLKHSFWYYGFVLTTAFLFITSSAKAGQRAHSLNQAIQQFVAGFEKKKYQINGGAIAIIVGNKTIYQRTFGYQKGKKQPITPYTLFPLASGSKPITATAVALLIKEGKLHLNQPVNLSMPGLYPGILLRHILSHSSGYQFSGTTAIESGFSRKKMLADLIRKKPDYSPGKNYYYSNALFSVVQEMISQATKRPWEQAVVRLWERLNQASHVRLCSPHAQLPLASPHIHYKKILRSLPLPEKYPKTVCSSAGVFATIEAIASFVKLQLGYRPDILTRKELALLHTPQIRILRSPGAFLTMPYPRKNIQYYYGVGWRVLTVNHRHDSRLIYHPGHLKGLNTFIGFIPSLNVGIVILANQHSKLPFQEGLNFWANCLNILGIH